MLATLMTALFFMVRAFGQLRTSLFHEEPLPYLVYQPLPWQVQYVTQSRRDSGKGESSRHGSIYSRKVSMPSRLGATGALPLPADSRRACSLPCCGLTATTEKQDKR
ncbi:uncharacterized protein LOC144278592 isoform X2 [Eretmochelys imbricata]